MRLRVDFVLRRKSVKEWTSVKSTVMACTSSGRANPMLADGRSLSTGTFPMAPTYQVLDAQHAVHVVYFRHARRRSITKPR